MRQSADVRLAPPSLTSFRRRIAAIVQHEVEVATNRHVLVLALDGIPYELARAAWSRAAIEPMRSVFPTTSASAWLTSLTGQSVDAHGVPGVLFKVPDGEGDLINVFEYCGEALGIGSDNLFCDAERFGYVPLSLVGDLSAYRCSWRDMLLSHSRALDGFTCYAGRGAYAPDDPAALCRRIGTAILDALRSHSHGAPCLVWCFVEVDRYVHRFGYDEHVMTFLASLEKAIDDWLKESVVVVAYSDHGLTPTVQNRRIADALEDLQANMACSVGGAGRTRWIYCDNDRDSPIREYLARTLPSDVRVRSADDLFVAGSLAHRRVGRIVLMADGEGFLIPSGYRFDHGSMTTREVEVPFAIWQS